VAVRETLSYVGKDYGYLDQPVYKILLGIVEQNVSSADESGYYNNVANFWNLNSDTHLDSNELFTSWKYNKEWTFMQMHFQVMRHAIIRLITPSFSQPIS
jgi:hypothetical protein